MEATPIFKKGLADFTDTQRELIMKFLKNHTFEKTITHFFILYITQLRNGRT